MKTAICPHRYETILMTLNLLRSGTISETYASVYIRYALMPYKAIFVEFCELTRVPK